MLLQRIKGVFKFDVATFESIEQDKKSFSQALFVVFLVAVIVATGYGLYALYIQNSFVTAFIACLIWTFIGWFLWSLVTFLIGTLLFKGTATLPEMMRVLGFSFAPLLLSIIPCIGSLVGGIWALAAGFIAVRQGLDLDDLKTTLTVGAGFLLLVLGWGVLQFLLTSFF